MAVDVKKLKPYIPAIVIAIVAIAIAWAFAVVTLRHTRPMGFPLDDSYIYLTYAKQFGRLQPFSYYPGGGYSAGSTSVLWPMVLAPFWSLGARGHALVWVSYLMCSGLYAASAVAVYRLARRLVDSEVAGIVAAGVLLSIACFAWTSLSGMEVAFASALIVWSMQLLVDAKPDEKPRRLLIACLAATSLSRPEAMMLVGAICGLRFLVNIRRRWRIALWWLAPLCAPIAWLLANKIFAGQLFPNTGVAKSHFYLPGFDWTYWFGTVKTQTGKLVKTLFWDGESPLILPRVFAVLWIAGCVRLVLAARKSKQWLVTIFVIVAPMMLMLAVVCSSGLWAVQNYRYITPAFALLVIPVGAVFADLPRVPKFVPWIPGLLLVAIFGWRGAPQMKSDMNLFAQGAMDTNTQVVAIGEWLAQKHPGDRVMFHDAGAVAYYGDTYVYDMLGLVTNYQAGVANNGPGSRFEFLERLAPEKRPTLFAYYPAWMGNAEFFGETLFRTPLRPGFEKRRLVGDGDMQVIAAKWDHVGTGERPFVELPGWDMVDRIDIADLASERAHDYRAGLGRRSQGDPTAKWSCVAKESLEHGLVIDGGRTIRDGWERFAIEVDATKPTKLVIRGGGNADYPYQDRITAPVALDVSGVAITLPAPSGPLIDVVVDLPAGIQTVEIKGKSKYRVFHYFVFQPAPNPGR